MTSQAESAGARPPRFGLAELADALGVTLGQPGNPGDNTPAGLTLIAEVLGVSPRWVRRLQKHGLSPLCADRYAGRIGRHPGSIWPAWWDLESDEGDDAFFGDDPALEELDAA